MRWIECGTSKRGPPRWSRVRSKLQATQERFNAKEDQVTRDYGKRRFPGEPTPPAAGARIGGIKPSRCSQLVEITLLTIQLAPRALRPTRGEHD